MNDCGQMGFMSNNLFGGVAAVWWGGVCLSMIAEFISEFFCNCTFFLKLDACYRRKNNVPFFSIRKLIEGSPSLLPVARKLVGSLAVLVN